MNRARHNPLNSAASHAVLILYTIIALFPVFVILINSFKTRRAIFSEPLALPTVHGLPVMQNSVMVMPMKPQWLGMVLMQIINILPPISEK